MEAITYYLTQMFAWNKLKAFCTFVLYILAAWVGWFDVVFVAMISLAMVDYVLGFAYWYSTNNISWSKLKRGIWKFPLYYLAIFSGYKLDEMLPMFLQEFGPVHHFIAIYLWVIEFLSIAKWLMRFEVKLPAKLIQKLEKYRDDMNGFEWVPEYATIEANEKV